MFKNSLKFQNLWHLFIIIIFLGGLISKQINVRAANHPSPVEKTGVTANTLKPAEVRAPTASTDLSISITDSADPVVAGTPFMYTITVSVTGSEATSVKVTDNLPSSLDYLYAVPSQGSCGFSASTLSCNLGTLEVGATATITLTVSANNSGTTTNTASVEANEDDTNTGNNSASENTTVQSGSSDICYAVADDGDLLVTVTRSTWSASGAPNGLGASDVEAIAYWPGTNTFYAADASSLGTIDVNTGLYTNIGSFGSANGALGNQTIDDVDGLGFDSFTGILYGTQRRSSDTDLLVQIDPATGAIVKDAFGSGVDYVEIPAVSSGLVNVDDIAISAITGEMYAVQNDTSGANDRMILINKTTGASSDVNRINDGDSTNIDDMEGLGVDALGNFYSTTGYSSSGTYANSYFTIVPSTAVATRRQDLSSLGEDYEATDCLVDGVNTIAGTVFADTDADAVYDDLETGTAGVTVHLYRDTNGNGEIDAGDVLVASQDTDANGNYAFTLASTGDFVLDIDTSTLPSGNILTTDNLEAASFSGFGHADAQNDFGHVASVTIGDRIWLDLDGDGEQDNGEHGIPNVTVELDTGNCTLGTDCPTAVTDSAGNYQFTDLLPGVYTVVVQSSTLPPGVTQTGDPDGTLDGQNTLGTFAGGSYLDVDFGYQGNASIGDKIWNDLDGNGVEEPTEGGIDGVTVWLDIDGDGIKDSDEPSTVTDENGYYLFTGFPITGTYTVTLRVDAGTGTPLEGAEPTYDPDGIGTANQTIVGLFELDNGTINDFGYQFPTLSVSKTSSANGSVNPGDIVTYTIMVRNNTDVQQQNIVISDTLPEGTSYVANSTWVTAMNSGEDNMRDEFSTQAYNNNDGTVNWAGDWQEENDDNSPTSGKMQITTAGEFQFHGTSDTDVYTATRSADLSTAIKATLTFIYHSRGRLENADTLEILVNNGSTWTVLDTLADDGDLDSGSYSRDITSYANANTEIGLRVTGFRQIYEYLYIDNVQIAYCFNTSTTTSQGGSPPNLVTASDGFNLCPRASMTVTFQITVDDPVVSGLGSIDNTVAVTSDQQSTPQTDSTTDDLPLASIGDLVWYDADGDGIQDSGEEGIEEITVYLYDPGDDGVIGGGDDVLIDSTITDENGNYSFSDILAESYYLDFELPEGYSATAQDSGSDDTLDSDINTYGQTPIFTLSAGDTENSFDAGLTSQLDYGDLPPNYNLTLRDDDGPSHTIGTLRLGNAVDAEADGNESPTANGDGSDDDGVTRDSSDNWQNNAIVDLSIDLQGSTASGESDVGIWIDWNQDNVYSAGEFFAYEGLTVGTVNVVQVQVPDSSVYTVGDTLNVRVRAFDPANLPGGSLDASDSAGWADNGEVEDYQWTFGPTAITLKDFSAQNSKMPMLVSLGLLLLVLLIAGWWWKSREANN